MSQPSPGDVHIDTALTNISVAFRQEDPTVGMRAFPVVPVMKQTDKYFEYDIDFWSRIIAEKRGPGSESAGSGYEISQKTYSTDKYSVHIDVPEEVIDNQDAPLNTDRDATAWITEQLKLRFDKTWSAAAFTTSVWTGSTTGGDITPGTLWDAAASTPVADIGAQRNSVLKKTGRRPNIIVAGVDVFTALESNDDILDRIKHTQAGIVTTDILAALFGVDEFIIGTLAETTTVEGAAASSRSFLQSSTDLLLGYRAPTPGLLMPSMGYTFVWTKPAGVNPNGDRIKRWWMDERSAWRIEGDQYVDTKVVAPDLAAYFSGAVS